MALKSVFLIRHVESLEDVDPSLHTVKDKDNGVGITDRGRSQGMNLGETWTVRFTPEDSLAVYLSPSFRVRETWNLLSSYFPKPRSLKVDKRIRNLDWGNTTLENRSQIERERYEAGVLEYQFPGGDNTPEYVSNINQFVEKAIDGRKDDNFPEYIVVVLHGFALRVIARFLLGISDVDFKWLRNPPNGYCLEIVYNVEEDSFDSTTPLLRMKPVE